LSGTYDKRNIVLKLKDLKQLFINSLKDIYPSEEVQSFFNLLANKHLSLSRIAIAIQPDKIVSEVKVLEFKKGISRLEKFEPIQYIIGDTEFFGLPFLVNKDVLIPRPETEELVSWIINDSKNKQASMLDVGTGSGCIAISLANKLKNATVSAIDISDKALSIAKQNALLNKVNVNFMSVDVLKFEKSEQLISHLDSKYDVIVSNPPYVRMLEKELIQPNVIEHEPDIALFVEDEDPLLFYRKISQLSKQYLKQDGVLYFEINEYLTKEMKVMLDSEGFKNIEIKKDIFEKDRMIKCIRK
jgi:release factor glutamine methyltransferase